MSVGADLPLGSGWKAADGTAFRASVATLVFPTKSPLKSTCARWSKGSLFGHWRSGVAFVQVSCRSTRRGVREHPAPSGALRRHRLSVDRVLELLVREHPAPSGALRQLDVAPLVSVAAGQGVPSTIRCIETLAPSRPHDRRPPVREHPAPSGALRHRLGACARPRPFPSGSTQHHQVH